jgi:hypothetical protein
VSARHRKHGVARLCAPWRERSDARRSARAARGPPCGRGRAKEWASCTGKVRVGKGAQARSLRTPKRRVVRRPSYSVHCSRPCS